MDQTMSAKEWAILILLSFFWGGSFFFNEIVLRELGPFTMVFLRLSVAGIILIAFVYITQNRLPSSTKTWGAFAVMGLINNLLPFSLIVWGQQYIDSGLAAVLGATTPLSSVILAHFVTGGERLTFGRATGVILGMIGIAFLVDPKSLLGLGAQGLAQLATLLAAFLYTVAAIFARRFHGMAPIVPAAGMVSAAGLLMLPIALLTDWPKSFAISWASILSIAWLAVLGTAIAYILYFRMIRIVGATNLLLVTFLIPINALILGSLVLGEKLGMNIFLGMGLIFAGLFTVDGRLLRIVRGMLEACFNKHRCR